MLYPGDKRERPAITYKIEGGSVRHILKTSIQYIIGFNAILGQISQTQNIDFLDLATAKAFENIQDTALRKNYSFSITTSLPQTNEIQLNPDTKYYRTEVIWVDAEFYFYGKVTNAGGKDKANIHIYTEEAGTVRIQTPIPFLEQCNDNILYKTLGIRASGRQHAETGEIDTSSLKFISLANYEPEYDEQYLKALRDKAKKSWLGNIDPDQWLREIRGYDA